MKLSTNNRNKTETNSKTLLRTVKSKFQKRICKLINESYKRRKRLIGLAPCVKWILDEDF